MSKPKTAPRDGIWWRYSQAHRVRLFNESTLCHWCGTVTILDTKPALYRRAGGKLATLDHVKSYPECSTVKEWAEPANLVLSCFACNQKRGNEWQKANPDYKPEPAQKSPEFPRG